MAIILITGGAGNVGGGSLAIRLVKDPVNFVVVADNLSTGSISNLPDATVPNFKFIQADVNNYDELSAIMLSFKFEYVFHYAAVVGVKRTLESPILVLRDIDGIKNMLNLAKNTGVKRIFYSSSSEVYGEPVTLPQHEETTPLNSRLPYAVVKNIGEAFCRSYFQEFGLSYTVFRFFNTYGPGQSEDFVLPLFLKAALKNAAIHIYGDGSQTRTLCFVDDNIETTVKILEKNLAVNDTINVGSDVEITMLALAEKIIALTKSTSKIIHLPPLIEGDMTRRKPDITKMKSILQRPLTNLDEGIKLLIRHLNQQG